VYDGKLVIVNSEFDKSGSSWIVASLATSTASMPSRAHPTRPMTWRLRPFASRSTPASYEFALRAHFLQGDRWVRRGTPPPASYHLKTQGNTIERDANGNAITVNASGQPVPRLPFIELGEARFVTGLVGSYDNVKTLADLGFPSHAALRQGFQEQG
jgi:hypothetical protein